MVIISPLAAPWFGRRNCGEPSYLRCRVARRKEVGGRSRVLGVGRWGAGVPWSLSRRLLEAWCGWRVSGILGRVARRLRRVVRRLRWVARRLRWVARRLRRVARRLRRVARRLWWVARWRWR